MILAIGSSCYFAVRAMLARARAKFGAPYPTDRRSGETCAALGSNEVWGVPGHQISLQNKGQCLLQSDNC